MVLNEFVLKNHTLIDENRGKSFGDLIYFCLLFDSDLTSFVFVYNSYDRVSNFWAFNSDIQEKDFALNLAYVIIFEGFFQK